MRSDAQNIEAISKAIDQHNANCPWPAVEVRMCAFEVDRLKWDEIRGCPIVADPQMQSGRFRIVCAQEKDGGEELVNTVQTQRPLAAPASV